MADQVKITGVPELNQDYFEKAQEVVATEDVATSSPFITLSSGVVLRKKRIAPLRIEQVVGKFKYDPPPKVEDPNGRMVPNPDHPAYITHKQEVDEQRALAAVDALILFGTEIESLPPTIRPLEDDTWIEEMEFFGVQIKADNKFARYIAWVKFEAIHSDTDVTNLVQGVVNNLGISEERVAQAIDSFRSQTIRGTDPSVDINQDVKDEHRDTESAGMHPNTV